MKKTSSNSPQSFVGHLNELRNRIIWVALVFLIGSCLAYSYRLALIGSIMAPLHGQKLVYLTPGGGFSFIFQISMYAGLLVAAPVLVYQLYAFIRPALPERAKRSASKVVFAATALLGLGLSYGYFVAIPAALQFLTTFAGDSVTANLTADSYLSFFLSYVAGLAILSLLPLFLLFWHWIHPLTPGGLFKTERWIILFAFIAAAIVTPTPDAANQSMIAVPIIILYQLGVFAVMVSIKRAKRAKAKSVRLMAVDKSAQSLQKLQPVLAALAAPAPVSVPALAASAIVPIQFSQATPSTSPKEVVDVNGATKIITDFLSLSQSDTYRPLKSKPTTLSKTSGFRSMDIMTARPLVRSNGQYASQRPGRRPVGQRTNYATASLNYAKRSAGTVMQRRPLSIDGFIMAT